MTKSAELLVEARERGVVAITVNRPRTHNALSRTVLAALAEGVRAAGASAQTRCVLLRGAGERYFAAGGDLVDLASVRTKAATRRMADEGAAALDAVRACAVPVIAYVNGDALGGGAELAVACDLRLAAPHAHIAYIHGRMAITPAWGGGSDLCELVGSARAMRMMSRCESVDARTAFAWGLVDEVVAGRADVAAFLAPLLELSPAVLRGIKAQTRAWRAGRSKDSRRALERDHLVTTWLGDDHWKAVARFLDRKR